MFLRHAWLDRASRSPIGVGDDECIYLGMTRECMAAIGVLRPNGAKTERIKIFSGASGGLLEWLVS